MDTRIVLTSAPGGLTHGAVARASHLLDAAAHWLEPGTACDFPVSGWPETAIARIRHEFHQDSIDANLVPVQHRRKRLLVADMDSTIIGCECIDELADQAGIKDQVAAITERSMRGELNFEASLKARVALLKGLSVRALVETYRDRVKLNPGARALIRTMAAHGARTALVSGGFTFFAERVAVDAGFDLSFANTLLVADGVLTGAVQEPILGREAKAATLHRLSDEAGFGRAEIMAVGDGANDFEMIRAAGLGVAYRAKPLLKEAAHAILDHSDLRALLYLQGYRADEIVEN